MNRNSATTLLILLALPGFASALHAQSSWQWEITPYLWGSDIGLDVSINDEPVLGGTVSFSDLVDKLDFAFSLHTEGMKGSNGILIDFMWIDLGDRVTSDGSGGAPVPPGTQLKTDVETLLLELGGIYDPGDGEGFALLYGARITDVTQKFDITLPLPMGPSTRVDTASTLIDGFIGGRYTGQISESWGWRLRGDIGAGDSDAVLNAVLGFAWAFGQNGKYGLNFAYRYMNMEFGETSDGVNVETEMEFSGPMVGFRISPGR